MTGSPTLSDLQPILSGKVRDIYNFGEHLLLVTSDRISTYDCVHPNAIPDKGKVLNGITVFWFGQTKHIVPNHLVSATNGVPAEVRGRAVLARKLEMFPVECVVRGYLTGSGWADYQATGKVCGIDLPTGLHESDRLPEPIFTPATKAAIGDHDQNVTFDQAAELLDDQEAAARLRDISIQLYNFAEDHARKQGIILADSKFEFGRAPEGEIVLGDEVVTPDSSRFWPADQYEPGRPQASFDKQFVRDWATASGWGKTEPAPELPQEIVKQTRAKYIEAYERIVGEPFEKWLEAVAA